MASCREPLDPIVSSPRETPEEGLEGGEAQRSMVPPRQPLVVGALAVMLLASSINEVKLGVPAVSIRLGLQACHRLIPGTATLAASCDTQQPKRSDLSPVIDFHRQDTGMSLLHVKSQDWCVSCLYC